MEKEEVYSKLCFYDKRNPNNVLIDDEDQLIENKKNCSCDNCFYGKTELAEEILRLYSLIK